MIAKIKAVFKAVFKYINPFPPSNLVIEVSTKASEPGRASSEFSEVKNKGAITRAGEKKENAERAVTTPDHHNDDNGPRANNG